MKRLSFLAATVFLLSTMNIHAQNNNVQQVKNNNESNLYQIGWKNLSFGNNEYSQKLLRIWKDYDNNTLDNSASLFAEDVFVTTADGMAIKGRDNFLKLIKEYRGSFSAVSSTVDAVTTLKSPDHPDREVALIWGTETDTKKDGTTTKVHIHEVWFFNKEGKVVEMHQFAAKDGTEKK